MIQKRLRHKIAVVITTLLITAMPMSVFAKMDGVVLKDGSGKLYKFDYEQLKNSLINSGALYTKFQSLKQAGASVYSYHDDVQGKYVLRSDIINAFVNSTGTGFNARLATETLPTTSMPSTVYDNIEKSDGTVEETPESSTNLPSFTVTAEYSADLFGTKIVITLDGVSASDLSKYVVKYDGTVITPSTTTNTYNTFVNGNVSSAVAQSKVTVELANSGTDDTDFDVEDIY